MELCFRCSRDTPDLGKPGISEEATDKASPTTASSLLSLDGPLCPRAEAKPLRMQRQHRQWFISSLGLRRKGLVLGKGQGQAVLFSSSKTEKAGGNHPSAKHCRGQVKSEFKNKSGGAHLLEAVYIT